jgi:hypothetical protein
MDRLIRNDNKEVPFSLKKVLSQTANRRIEKLKRGRRRKVRSVNMYTCMID